MYKTSNKVRQVVVVVIVAGIAVGPRTQQFIIIYMDTISSNKQKKED